MPNVHFISDLHLGHENLMKFRNEVHGLNFNDVVDMNIWLVSQWNKKVHTKDLVWVLGDVSWSKEALDYLHMMNGTKRLVLGNHDTERLHVTDFLPYFTEIHGVLKKYGAVMSHVPLNPSELHERWQYNIHGHIHHKDKDLNDPRYINVNVDYVNGLPMSLDEVRSRYV